MGFTRLTTSLTTKLELILFDPCSTPRSCLWITNCSAFHQRPGFEFGHIFTFFEAYSKQPWNAVLKNVRHGGRQTHWVWQKKMKFNSNVPCPILWFKCIKYLWIFDAIEKSAKLLLKVEQKLSISFWYCMLSNLRNAVCYKHVSCRRNLFYWNRNN